MELRYCEICGDIIKVRRQAGGEPHDDRYVCQRCAAKQDESGSKVVEKAEDVSLLAASPADETGGPDMRPAAIIARKMQRGDAVGEAWLWGRNAVELATSGLIDRETVARYRSAAFLARRSVYGEASALAWEADAKARHEAAKDVWRHRRDPAVAHGATIPDKSAPYDPRLAG